MVGLSLPTVVQLRQGNRPHDYNDAARDQGSHLLSQKKRTSQNRHGKLGRSEDRYRAAGKLIRRNDDAQHRHNRHDNPHSNAPWSQGDEIEREASVEGHQGQNQNSTP